METVTEVTDSGAKDGGAQGVPRLCAHQDGDDRRKLARRTQCAWCHRFCRRRRQQGAFPSPRRRSQPSAWKSAKLWLATTSATPSRSTTAPLESFLGTVEEIDIDKNKVRVVVSMFGRETPVELELDQVETIGLGRWRKWEELKTPPDERSCVYTYILLRRCSSWHRKHYRLCEDCRSPPARQLLPPLSAPLWASTASTSPRFTKEFNERTKNDVGLIIPVVITVYADRSFTFITKTPPAAVLIKKACRHRDRLRRAQQDQGCHHQPRHRSYARSPRPRCPTSTPPALKPL